MTKLLTVKQINQQTNFVIMTLSGGAFNAASLKDSKSFTAKSMLTIRRKVTSFFNDKFPHNTFN